MVVTDSPPGTEISDAPPRVAHDSSSWPRRLRVIHQDHPLPCSISRVSELVWVELVTSAVTVCVAGYLVRMFAITAGYHRYFSHRTFKTSRWMRILVCRERSQRHRQLGPLWWAAHHRDRIFHFGLRQGCSPARFAASSGLIWDGSSTAATA